MSGYLESHHQGEATLAGRHFAATTLDNGRTWSVAESDRPGVEWLLVPRPGRPASMVILAEITDGIPSCTHRVLDVCSIEWETGDDVAAAVGDYALLTHPPVDNEHPPGPPAQPGVRREHVRPIERNPLQRDDPFQSEHVGV